MSEDLSAKTLVFECERTIAAVNSFSDFFFV